MKKLPNDIQVSAVVPVFMVEGYLNRCVESLVHQTLQNIEIILIDDKSSDNSPKLCDEWAKRDERIRVIHKSSNEGLGMARNTGIGVACGEYITFPDSDDFLELDSFEKAYEYAKEGNYDAVYYEFNTDEYPGFHAVTYPQGIYNKKSLDGVMLDMIGAEPEYQSDVKFQVSAAKALYKLDVIKKNNLRFVSERQFISEDLIWNLNFLHVSKSIRCVTDRFYHYCMNRASLSHVCRPDRYQRTRELYKYIEGNYTEWFNDKDEFSLRLNRTKLFQLRLYAISALEMSDKNAIQEALSDTELSKVMKDYPFCRMQIRYRMFYYLLRKQHFTLLKLFLAGKKLNDRKRVSIFG